MLFFFILILLCLQKSFSGQISPSKLYTPIVNTVTNANQYANYTFYFILQTAIPPNSKLKILFPQQFSSNLGINIVTSTSCSHTCTISSYVATLTFPYGLASGIESAVTISNVKNPISSGGTGYFQLSTIYNSYVFDENMIFGKLGIGPQPEKLTACYLLIANESEAFSGKTTEYHLSFKTVREVPYQSFMKLTLPLSSGFSFPSDLKCSTYSINSMNLNVPITCTRIDNTIIFTGLTENIPMGFDVGLKFFLTNPTFSGYTDTFVFQIFRIDTHFIYDSRDDVPAIMINPAQMIDVTLLPNNSSITLGLSKVVLFELNFVTVNIVPSNGLISIIFPNTFQCVFNSKIDYVYIVNGIIDYNSTVQAEINFDSSRINITKFKAINISTLITIRFNAITPSISALSTSLYISTYTLKGLIYKIIDYDNTNTSLTILNIPSSSTLFPNGIKISNINANGDYNTLTFTITPSVNVPSSGFISIKVPSDFILDTPAVINCLVDSAGTVSQQCTKPSTDTILVNLPGSIVYYIGVSNTLILTGIVKNPQNNGTFLFDINTYASDGITLLESFTDYVILSGASLITASGYLIGSSISIPPEYVYSIFVITFTLEKELTGGSGLIMIKTYPPWDFDLGTGLSDNSAIPCEAITNIANIKCVIKIGSLKSPTQILVTGFETIASGSSVEIHFPKFRNPVTAGTSNFDIYLINATNRVYYVLNYKTITITIYASAITPSTSTPTYSPTPNPVIVSSTFSLTYLPRFTVTIPATSRILLQFPVFDIGFFSGSSNIICMLQAITYPCKVYASVQWVLISITSAFTPTGTTPTITLQNLVWPRYYYVPSEGILGYILGSTTYQQLEIVHLNSFIPQSADTFLKAEVNVDQNKYNSVGCFYNFSFQANNDIPESSDIYLTFPSIYNLLSTPQPWLIPKILPTYSKFEIVNILQVKISSVAAIPKTQEFWFQIGGIKNPGFGSASTGWVIQAKLEGNLLNTFSAFTVSFTLNGLFSPAVITLNAITAKPANRNIRSIYTIDFVTNIPYIVYPSASIFLIFPSRNYPNLPSYPSCNISLGMTYYEDIAISGSSYLIETSQILSNTSQRIKFIIKDVLNPLDIGETDTFTIIVVYDGTIISKTDSSLIYSLIIFADAGSITVSEFSLTPMNEAETTKIQISFDLSHTLSSNNIIKLIFPSVYDLKLSESQILCTGVQSINTQLNCWGDDRILNINGILATTLSQTIIISISNIINPNYIANSNTGSIALAIQTLTDPQYLYYIAKANVFTLLAAPAFCLINNITIANLYSRLETDYTFNLTFYTSIPTVLALGKIYILFPSQYDIPDNSALGCYVVSGSYGTSICSVTSNVVIITGNTKEFSGNLIITLQNIKNPTNVGSIDQFLVYSYDGYNFEVLERSYQNIIGIFSYSFRLKGNPVLVNNENSLTIQVGTQSELVYITIDNPSILNLTIKPLVSGFSVIPSTLALYAGTVSTSFRVSIPEAFTIGTYYILWETSNDDELLFTPLKKTKIIVVSNNKVSISVSPIYDIQYLGQSLPITFSVLNPPNTQVSVNIYFSNSSLIKSNPSTLIFTSGVTSLSTIFTPTAMASLESSVIVIFNLSGVSSSSFGLSLESYTINFLDSDSIKPVISYMIIAETTRTYVKLDINTNKPVIAYYMYALAGTSTPNFLEVSESGPPTSLTTESVYGYYVVHNNGRILLNGLLAQKNYTIFVYIQDQIFQYSGPEIMNFQTSENYRPALFSVRINKLNLSNNEKIWLKENIAYFLALNITNFEERKYDLGLLSAADTVSSTQSIIYFYIIAMPFNIIMPKPLNLANSIQGQAYNISKNYKSFDSTFTINTVEFPVSVPNILSIPNIINVTDSSITFSISLDNYGYVFVLASPLLTEITTMSITDYISNTTNATNTTNIINNITTTTIVNNSELVPTSYQIYKGLNSKNLDTNVLSQSLEISAKSRNFSFVFSGLNQNTSYILFVTVGNVHPYLPDLADNSKIVKLYGTTLVKKVEIVQTIFSEKIPIFNYVAVILSLIVIII